MAALAAAGLALPPNGAWWGDAAPALPPAPPAPGASTDAADDGEAMALRFPFSEYTPAVGAAACAALAAALGMPAAAVSVSAAAAAGGGAGTLLVLDLLLSPRGGGGSGSEEVLAAAAAVALLFVGEWPGAAAGPGLAAALAAQGVTARAFYQTLPTGVASV